MRSATSVAMTLTDRIGGKKDRARPRRPNSRNSSHPSGGARSSLSPQSKSAYTRFRPEEVGGGEKRAAALLSWFDRHRRVLPWRAPPGEDADPYRVWLDRKSTRLNSSHSQISYAVFCLQKKKNNTVLLVSPAEKFSVPIAAS